MRLARSPYVWIALVYTVTWLAMPADGVWINDNGVKRLQAENLLRSSYGDFSLGWPGAKLDTEMQYQPLPPPLGIVKDGELFASYPPAFALLLALPISLFGNTGAQLVPLLGVLLMLPAVRRLADAMGHSSGAGRLAVLLTGLATPVWFYSFTIWEHTLSLAAALWCLVAMLRLVEVPSVGQLAVLCGCAGAGVLLRTEGYLLAGVVLAVVTGRLPGRWRLALPLGLVVAMLPVWGVQYLLQGHPFGLHVASQLQVEQSLSGWLAERGNAVSNLLLNCHPSFWASVAIAGIFWSLLLWRPRLEGERARVLVVGMGGLAMLTAAVITAALVKHPRPMYGMIALNGLFAAAPLAGFAFLRLPDLPEAAARARRLVSGVLWIQVAMFAALAPAINTTGIHWGCRFLLVAYPVLAALAAPALVRAWRLGGRGVVAALALSVLAACAQQWVAVGMLAARKSHNAEINARVASHEPQAIVTDVWFLPPTLTASFHRAPIFLVKGPRGVRAVLARLEHAGVSHALLISSEAGAAPGTVAGPRTVDGPMALARLRMKVIGTGGGS